MTWIAPPCHRKPAFTNPVPGTATTEEAFEICAHCPLRKKCAEQALTAGDTTDGCVAKPASGVIQAGILCTGDALTAWRLARVAGVPMPELRDTTRKNTPAPYCKGCGSVMVSWTRGEIPEGTVMHYAKSFCTHCRSAYREFMESEPEATPGPYDQGRTRSRFDRPEPKPVLRTEPQLQLF